ITPKNGLPEFLFVGTHLCHQSEATRREQTKELRRLFSTGSAGPVILAGDLNARPKSPPMRELLDNEWLNTVGPMSRIDYILLRNQDAWKVVETVIVDEPIVSDHNPVLTVLEWVGEG
ncbi:MAG: endonuclease/exonuclease/phosphatase family protein, partial [Planctomycetota bacterium]